VIPTFSVATPGDAAILLSLIRELAEFERLSHEVVGTEDDLRHSLFGPTRFAESLIARVDGEVAGFALYFHNFSTFLCRPGIHLEDLYIRPAFRGHGVGRRLLLEVARIASERGCGRLEWSVLNWNRRAIEFYESMGARPVDGWTVYRLDRAALDQIRLTHPGT
jgi:GNAT superfamily N-acetyltransferase